ncbi:hypothetical protein GC176_26865 [bacterium]|nr:hypothetical protein [bacterium]
MQRLRHGSFRPPYQFVADIANHALFSLDRERLQPGGDHRIALFTAAGLIEVTPDSIKHWNEEVMARWERQAHEALPQSRLTWRELINKLLSFHRQGGRWTYADIAEAANTWPGSDCQSDAHRIKDLLSSRGIPTRVEQLALERIAGLDGLQMNRIDIAIENGSLPLGRQSHRSYFSSQLADILGRLRVAGISQAQLVMRSIPLGQTEPALNEASLSMSKNGITCPTQSTMRGLVNALQRCHDRANRPLVTADELQQLVTATGFTFDDLAATTHDIVARINSTTRLKPLLSALRNATDLDVPMSAVDSDMARGGADEDARMAHLLRCWEWDGAPNVPTLTQVHQLLARYNRLLQDKGKAQLSRVEIERVVEVAERDREEGRQRGFVRRAQEHHSPTSRRTIAPDFDGGPTR